MSTPLMNLLWLAFAGVLLAVTVWSDVARQRIPNAAVLAGAVGGLALSALPGGIGFGNALLGLAVAFAFLLPLYLLGAMGAGDVKLAAALGTFTGFPGVLGLLLFTFAAGGVLALGSAAAKRNFGGVLGNLHAGLRNAFARVYTRTLPRAGDLPVSATRIPYAVAIAVGMAAYVLLVKGLT